MFNKLNRYFFIQRLNRGEKDSKDSELLEFFEKWQAERFETLQTLKFRVNQDGFTKISQYTVDC